MSNTDESTEIQKDQNLETQEVTDNSNYENNASEIKDEKTMIKDDKEIIAELESKLAESLNRELLIRADYENHKKQSIKNLQDNIDRSVGNLLTELFKGIDTFEQAIATEYKDVESCQSNFELVYQDIKTRLINLGIEMFGSTGEVFDANIHNAILDLNSGEQPDKRRVINQVYRQGYKYKSRVVKPADVVVSLESVEA